jgi:hypothetical protein
MKTFQEFISLTERYYKPDEKLPSGKTPYEKASASSDRQTEKYYSKPESERSLKDIRRLAKQNKKINQNVRHGADNPNFNLHWDPSGEVEVSGHTDDRMRVKNPKSNISFVISNTGKKTKDGKPVHDVEWYNTGKRGHEMDDKEKKDVLRSARDTWTKHISHRLPHGSVIRNFPLSNFGSDNGEQRYTRANLYSRIAGFGPRNDRTGYQFAGVGREPSPKQKAKGKKRTFPMNSNTAASSAFEEFIAIAERYYRPDEKLPSGKTAVQKATEKSRKRAKTIGSESPENQERWGRQYDLTQTKVKHGADNPKINARVSHKDKDDLKIDSDNDSTDIYHKPSGVFYTIYKSDDSPHSRTIEWGHDKQKQKSKMSPKERLRVARNAQSVWDQHVSHRLPHGSVVHNTPVSSYDPRGREKPVNRRSEIYKRAGFGDLDGEGDQFAKVGREPSPKQKAKGKRRLKPMSPSAAKWEVDWKNDDDDYNDWED